MVIAGGLHMAELKEGCQHLPFSQHILVTLSTVLLVLSGVIKGLFFSPQNRDKSTSLSQSQSAKNEFNAKRGVLPPWACPEPSQSPLYERLSWPEITFSSKSRRKPFRARCIMLKNKREAFSGGCFKIMEVFCTKPPPPPSQNEPTLKVTF